MTYINKTKLSRARQIVAALHGNPLDDSLVKEEYLKMGGHFIEDEAPVEDKGNIIKIKKIKHGRPQITRNKGAKKSK